MSAKPYTFKVKKPSQNEEQKFMDFIERLASYSDDVSYDRDDLKTNIEITIVPFEEIDAKALRTFTKQGY